MTHRFSVLLDCNLQVFLGFHLNKGLAAGTTLTRVGEVDAAATIVDNLAVCRRGRVGGGGESLMKPFLICLIRRGVFLKAMISRHIPEKNLCTSSTEQDQGRPRMRTT